MSLPHKNTGDTVTAEDYNKIADSVNKFASGRAVLVDGQITVNCPLVNNLLRHINVVYEQQGDGPVGFLMTPWPLIVNDTSFVIQSVDSSGAINTTDNAAVRWIVISDTE